MIAVLAAEESPTTDDAGSYWRQSRRPVASLLFILPLLIVYEGGTLWLGHEAIRNGADLWMQRLLGVLGFGGTLLLPLLTVAILLAWHHLSQQRWRFSASVLYAMAAESAVLALLLLLFAQLQARLLSIVGAEVPCALSGDGGVGVGRFAGELVRYLGAGIYEELLFRLMLLPAVIFLAKFLGMSWRMQVLFGVLATSLLFSSAHYVGPYGEAFVLYTFVFRFAAGCFFAVLFVYRGFGIAAGTHALYDVFICLPSL